MIRVALLVVPMLLALAACGGKGEQPVAEVPARWNTASAADIGTLTRTAGTVFVGKVTEKSGQGQVDRFPVSRFTVRVLESIAGVVVTDDEVTIEQPGGVAEDHDGRTVQVTLEGDAPINVGATYIFFATLRDDGIYTTAPFGRFEIEGSRLKGADAWVRLGAVAELDGANPGEAVEAVRNAAR